ncbi:hypothetical protein Mal4_05920 [Maioricimonas rarisocia]|uniref:Uncharacterized protein n=1 Tax=Maioricimonas rarisocia TaxID=2528026 RepID=A0A517Z1E7_9PLAN|nr:hypothetical protein [Maioricimonas rarisocia]QDU36307.1 hypothetical protein Mal4_05920 [Maioricimonas rarisocia]
MSAPIKKVKAWPFAFGGEGHSGWLPAGAAVPEPTPVEHELLDVTIESDEGGYLLIWAARPSPTCEDLRPPKSGDTWYETLEEALAAARNHFGIQHEDWSDVS